MKKYYSFFFFLELAGTKVDIISLLDQYDSMDIPKRDKLELSLLVGPCKTWKIEKRLNLRVPNVRK